MRKDIHPEYAETVMTCSCGSTFTTRSTAGGELRVELCSECHPFYTGQQKFVDTGGRVQRFSDKFGDAAAATLERESTARDARQKAADASADEARKAREIREAG
jgi:large subunit ribosomal protein L31